MSNNKKNKILLIEDDKFISHICKNGLQRAGFNVEEAKDGQEALRKMKKQKPDLILLDLVLPKKSGFEVLKQIKEQKELKDIPVIITSNLSQDSDIKKCQELGAVDYLIKSNLKIKEVIEKINSYLLK